VNLSLPASNLDGILDTAPGVIGDLFDTFVQLQHDGNDYALTLHVRLLAERRLAAIRLALRLYELEHGLMPESLALLTPQYLPAIPGDPFAQDDTTFRFRPYDNPPVLYSIGANGVDDGGRQGRHGTGRDVVFHLDGVVPEN
jgi:hypothetical protein